MSNVTPLRPAVPAPLFRWKAVAEYRTENGIVDVEHQFEEIEELHDLIERGPDWNTLVRCTVTLARQTTPDLTVEAAEKL